MESQQRTARSLIQSLSSATTDNLAAKAIADIRSATKQDPNIRFHLANLGAVPLLLAHLNPHPTVQSSTSEHAAAALLNLSISSPNSLMSTPGLLDCLTLALHSPITAHHVAATLYSLLTVDSYRPIVGSKRNLALALLSLLSVPDSSPRTTKDVLKALFGLVLYPLNRSVLVELGVLKALFGVVERERGKGGLAEDATAVLAQVVGCSESVEEMRRVGGVGLLVDMMWGKEGRVRENAVAALLRFVRCGGDDAVEMVVGEEGAVAGVREMAEGGEGVGERGKAKAEELLRVLESGRRRISSDHNSSSSFSSSVHMFSLSEASSYSFDQL